MELHAHGLCAQTVAAAWIILLLSCHIIFPTVTYAQAENGKDSEENIDPQALARELRAEICAANATQIQEFYREIIGEEDRDIIHPNAEQSKLRQKPWLLFNAYIMNLPSPPLKCLAFSLHIRSTLFVLSVII